MLLIKDFTIVFTTIPPHSVLGSGKKLLLGTLEPRSYR